MYILPRFGLGGTTMHKIPRRLLHLHTGSQVSHSSIAHPNPLHFLIPPHPPNTRRRLNLTIESTQTPFPQFQFLQSPSLSTIHSETRPGLALRLQPFPGPEERVSPAKARGDGLILAFLRLSHRDLFFWGFFFFGKE